MGLVQNLAVMGCYSESTFRLYLLEDYECWNRILLNCFNLGSYLQSRFSFFGLQEVADIGHLYEGTDLLGKL